MSEPLVLRDDMDGVATLTLNRPDKLNALNPALFVEFRAHVDAIATDETIGCVIVTGAGRSFCAGHDLGAIATNEHAPSKHFEAEIVDVLEELPKPTIAKIRGHCFTGGLEFALACDFLIAAESTKLGDTHGQWGLVPIWGMTRRLPERVGRSTAKELMFTSRRITGVEAADIQLVDHAVPDDALDGFVDTFAAEICENSWDTNRFVKQLIAGGDERSRDEALLWEREMPFGSPRDMKERMNRSR